MSATGITAQILAIQRDQSLTDAEKAKKRQALLSGKWIQPEEAPVDKKSEAEASSVQPAMFDDSLKCAMCMELCARPVTAPCQHNFCLACFKKWVAQGKKTCPTCRNSFPAKFAVNPRINTALTTAIRMAKQGLQDPSNKQAIERIKDKDRPDEAYTTDRAVRAGRANAASGRIMVNVPNDHFGPIPPEADPRGLGVRVGESWKDRLDCRQWGAHFPHVAGIAGQSTVGAQSVVLSGGYEDDRDEGEWFLYTGSGGRDLSGNKRTNKEQSFDQKFESSNKALLISCQKGLPLRVVRSHKEKRSAYAPTEEEPVRYDGIYRIARCWRKAGAQKFLVCRYLFIRCDNEPAPWSSEDVGDSAWGAELPKDALQDMKEAQGTVYKTADQPWWDYNADKKQWGWARPAPVSQKQGGEPDTPKKLRKKASEQERALREFMCKLCSGVLNQPASAPCGHHFCKPCLDRHFQGQGDVVNRGAKAGRALRVQKMVKPCPTCKADIADFLNNCQVNRDMQVVIDKLQAGARKAQEVAHKLESPQATAQAAEDLAEEVENAEAMAADGLTSAEKVPKSLPPVIEAQAENVPAEIEDGQGATAPAATAASSAEPAKQAVPHAPSVQNSDLDQLCQEFPDFDRGLLEGMLADQGGDVPEVHACLRRMVKQSAAAQRKADAETRKAAKASATAEASTAAAGSTTAVAGSSQAAVAAGPQATKGTAKQARAASAAALPQAEPEADPVVVTAVAAAGKAGKAELHTDADSSQVRQPAETQAQEVASTSAATTEAAQPAHTKPEPASTSLPDQSAAADIQQRANGAAAGDVSVAAQPWGSDAEVKAPAGKKRRAAEPVEAVAASSKRATRSTKA